MSTLGAKELATFTYNAAADRRDDAFWIRLWQQTVEGSAYVLGMPDACWGTGASALPAAERVGRRKKFSEFIFLSACSNGVAPLGLNAMYAVAARPSRRQPTPQKSDECSGYQPNVLFGPQVFD